MNGSWGRLKNLKLFGSYQLIFQPEISGFDKVDTAKSKGFRFSGKISQKLKYWCCPGVYESQVVG
jgi:hypothetical protein